MTRFAQPAPPELPPPANLWDSLTPPEVMVPSITPRPDSIEAAFLAHREAAPFVGDALRRMALELVDRGATRLSVAALFERLRQERFTTEDGTPWKLNNTLRGSYGRWLAATEPRLADKFEFRRRTSS